MGMRFQLASVLLILFLLCIPQSRAERESVGVLYDSEVVDAVNKIILPICKAAKIIPTNVYILISDEINAFVTQGNELFINTGLIAAFNDPDVLKGVVAHELAHLASGHPTVRDKKVEELMSQSILTSLLGLSAILTGNPELGMAILMGGRHATQSMYLKYSREQETIADRLAVQYLHEAGTSVSGFMKLTEHFAKQELYFEQQNITPYMLTHPLSKERLKAVREYSLQEKKDHNIHSTTEFEKDSYDRVVAKLRAFLHPDQYFKDREDLTAFAKEYGDAIAYYRKGQFAHSFEILDKLLEQHPTDGYLHELKGQFLLETGKPELAMDEYKKAIMYLGQQSGVKTDYAIMLIDSSDPSNDKDRASIQEAIAMLNEPSVFTRQKNPYIYRKLAVAYGKLGLLGYSNLMLAEEALLLQKESEAIKFLKSAKHYADSDSKLQLKIDDIEHSLNIH
jgi:predicted Zn-dependent protease